MLKVQITDNMLIIVKLIFFTTKFMEGWAAVGFEGVAHSVHLQIILIS